MHAEFIVLVHKAVFYLLLKVAFSCHTITLFIAVYMYC